VHPNLGDRQIAKSLTETLRVEFRISEFWECNEQSGSYRSCSSEAAPEHHLYVHVHHTIHHNLSTFCAQKRGSTKPGEYRCKREQSLTEPKINHKAPQLTTNPEDHFFHS
jgi:hypothetical protein